MDLHRCWREWYQLCRRDFVATELTILTHMSGRLYPKLSRIWVSRVSSFGSHPLLTMLGLNIGFADSRMSNVLTMPPAFAAFALVLVLGHFVRNGTINPFPTVVVLDIILIVCYIVLITVDVVGVRYFILVISTAASQCIYPMLYVFPLNHLSSVRPATDSYFPFRWPKRVQALRGTAMAGLGIGRYNTLRFQPASY